MHQNKTSTASHRKQDLQDHARRRWEPFGVGLCSAMLHQIFLNNENIQQNFVILNLSFILSSLWQFSISEVRNNRDMHFKLCATLACNVPGNVKVQNFWPPHKSCVRQTSLFILNWSCQNACTASLVHDNYDAVIHVKVFNIQYLQVFNL